MSRTTVREKYTVYFASAARANMHRRDMNTETWLVVEELDDLLECICEQDAQTERLVDGILAAIEASTMPPKIGA